MHEESLVPPVDNETIYEAPKTVQVDSIPLHRSSSGMQDMLSDVFAMRDICVKAGGSQVGVEAGAKSVDVEIEDFNMGTFMGYVIKPSWSVVKGYNKVIKGKPNITLSVKFLTRTNVLKQILSWQTWALLISKVICILLPLVKCKVSFDLL
jgi:hypothetical protein